MGALPPSKLGSGPTPEPRPVRKSVKVCAHSSPFPGRPDLAPKVEELANPALKARHWTEVFDLIGADVGPNEAGTGGLGRGGDCCRGDFSCFSHCPGSRTPARDVCVCVCGAVMDCSTDNRAAEPPPAQIPAHTRHPRPPNRPGFAPFSIRHLLQFDLLDKLERLQTIGTQASRGGRVWGVPLPSKGGNPQIKATTDQAPAAARRPRRPAWKRPSPR